LSALTSREFIIRSLTGKCFDFGNPQFHAAGAPVMLNGCNGTTAQAIRIEEVDAAHHTVLLRDGDRFCVAPILTPEHRLGAALTLQTCTGSADQQYTLDGDSIISLVQPGSRDLYRQRFVVEIQHGTTADRTPLVLGSRETDDSELWTFTARDGSLAKPTTGFRTARTAAELLMLLHGQAPLEPGSVVEVEANISLPQDDLLQLTLPEGVTLRGVRHGLVAGHTIATNAFPETLINVTGTNTRITGLTFRGATGGISTNTKKSGAIGLNTTKLSFVDHNELLHWTSEAVEVKGTVDGVACRPPHARAPDPTAMILRNYIHENARQNAGYGVSTSNGGIALVQGNVFEYNRHAVASTYDAYNEYFAYDNLILPSAPTQFAAAGFIEFVTHDFDAHGSNRGSIPEYTGGTAGDYYDIGWNTFTASKSDFLHSVFVFGVRENFNLRGTPCSGARYHDNVSRQSEGDSVSDHSTGHSLVKWGNVYNAPDPLAQLGYGDFDGDGHLDSFAATGAGWYLRSGGTAPWAFLRRSSTRLPDLILQDRDGDGRTDVTYTLGNTIYTAWAGISPGDQIGTVSLPPPPPPHRCSSSQKCCEPDGHGGCGSCAPKNGSCP
jgi:hypothetical protein